jgi:capsular polysaccharide biosynthesis protein
MNYGDRNQPLNARLTEFATYLRKYKYWFILSVAVFLLAAFAYQWLHQPIYNVSTVIEVNHHLNSQGKQTKSLSQTSDNALQSFTRIIRSDAFLKEMLRQMDTGLFKDELNDLQITTGNKPNTVILSTNTTTPKHTTLFLNSLYTVYEHESKTTAFIQNINDSLAFLGHFITTQTEQENLLKNRIGKFAATKQTPAQNFEAKKQLDILKTIKPYLSNAANQYQLIPTTFPVTDPYINNLILQFNDAQDDKQSLLSDSPDQAEIMAANQNIIVIQNLLASAIDSASEQKLKTSARGIATINSKGLKDSLANLKRTIDENINNYAALLARKRAYQHPDSIAESARQPLAINITPVNGNMFGLYIIAILSGILLPLAILYIFGSHFKKTNDDLLGIDIPVWGDTSSPDGSTKLTDKISHLLAPKQNRIILITSDTVFNKDLLSLKIGFQLIGKKDKLVIVDLDFDIDPAIASNSQPTQPGVIDFITGRTTSLADIVMPMPHPAISTIGKGRNRQLHPSIKGNDIVPDAANEDIRDTVLNSAKLGLLINHLAAKFNHIILNTSSLNYPANFLPLTKISDINLVIFNNRPIPNAARLNLNKLVAKYCIKDIYIIKN